MKADGSSSCNGGAGTAAGLYAIASAGAVGLGGLVGGATGAWITAGLAATPVAFILASMMAEEMSTDKRSSRVGPSVGQLQKNIEQDSSRPKSRFNLASKFYAAASAVIIGASALTGSFAAVAMATGAMAAGAIVCPLLLSGAAKLSGKVADRIADYKDKRDAKTIDAYLRQKEELGLNGVEAGSPGKMGL